MAVSKEGLFLLEMVSQYGDLQNHIKSWPKQYEFGADTDENVALVNILKKIQKYLQGLKHHFDLATTSLANANYYYRLITLTEKLLAKIQKINSDPFGTRQNAFEIREAIENIIEQLEFVYNFIEQRN